MVLAGSSSAAIDACIQSAASYAKLADQTQAEATCKSAKAAAMASGQCSSSANSRMPTVAVTSTCARYLSCVFAAEPLIAANASASYGAQGACWATQTEATCTDGCRLGIGQLHQAHPTVTACNACVGDSDCSGETPVCDLAHGDCVGIGAGSCRVSVGGVDYCGQYPGSGYTADTVKAACAQASGSYSPGPCATGTGKTCFFEKGTSNESQWVFYGNQDAKSMETLCTNAGGTYE